VSSNPLTEEEKAARLAAAREKKIHEKAQEKLIDRAADRLVKQWEAEQEFTDFEILGGDETSEDEQVAEEWLIEKLFPNGASTLLAAGPKAGKTVLGLNVSDCLLTGNKFLDEFEVRKLREDEVILYINMEVVPAEFKKMMDVRGLTGNPQFKRMHLRGKEHNMNFRNPAIKEMMEKKIRDSGATILIIDPVGVIFSVMGITTDSSGSNDDIREFYMLFDSLRETTNVREILYVIHAGHATDNMDGRQSIARGASALAATPDALWNYYLSDSKDAFSQRMLRATGRYGVRLEPTKIEYEPETIGLKVDRSVTAFGPRKKTEQDGEFKPKAASSTSTRPRRRA